MPTSVTSSTWTATVVDAETDRSVSVTLSVREDDAYVHEDVVEVLDDKAEMHVSEAKIPLDEVGVPVDENEVPVDEVDVPEDDAVLEDGVEAGDDAAAVATAVV